MHLERNLSFFLVRLHVHPLTCPCGGSTFSWLPLYLYADGTHAAMEQYLREEGQAWVAEDRKDTQHFKESTHAFDTMSLDNPHREKLLDILWADFIAHARKEEDVQLSKLDSVLGNEKSSRLARMFEKTKRLTATRPHPGSPNELPWATASAFMAAPIDKVRDMFRLFPDEEEVK